MKSPSSVMSRFAGIQFACKRDRRASVHPNMLLGAGGINCKEQTPTRRDNKRLYRWNLADIPDWKVLLKERPH